MKLPLIVERESVLQLYGAGATIFTCNDPGDVMYLVKSGEVDIIVNRRTVETVVPGDILGEMALIDKGPRSADARAKTDCELQPITQRQFTFMVQETPFFALEVMRTMSRRLRRKNCY